MARSSQQPLENSNDVQAAIMDAYGHGAFRIYRNNVGACRTPAGRLLHYGLGVGTSDLIGMASILITPQHVGQLFARFVALEVKTGKDRPTRAQRAFVVTVQELGGIAAVVRSINEASFILGPNS